MPARENVSSTKHCSPPDDWSTPKKTLIVIGSQRSGSTLLCSMMSQTGRLGNPDEFFKGNPYPRWNIAPGTDSLALRCGLARTLGASPNDVCAIKLFTYHFSKFQDKLRLLDWFPNPMFLWIQRRDVLGQAISASIAQQTGRYRSFYKDKGRIAKYSGTEIFQCLQKAALNEARWRVYLAKTGFPYHELTYEDLTASPVATMQGIADFIGIEIDPTTLSIDKSGLGIQRSEINELWRERFLAEKGDPNHLLMDLSGAKATRKSRLGKLGQMLKALHSRPIGNHNQPCKKGLVLS